MIDETPDDWPAKPRRNADHIEIYADHDRLWRWRLIAGNGRIRDGSTQGFTDRRNLVANLQASTHMIMLDQDQQLNGPRWYLYGVQPEYGTRYPASGQVIMMPVSGTVLAVHTPDPKWKGRKRR